MTQEDTKLDALLRKIRALRRKAEGTTNEHEAEAFSAKVQELMSEYGLEESALVEKEQEGIEGDTFVDKGWNSSPTKRAMINACARLYMCRLVDMGHGRWTLVGRRHNIAITKEMADYLVHATRRLSKGYSRVSKEQIDFRRGCFHRLAERLVELRRTQTEQTAVFTPQGNPGNLPALYKHEGQLVKEKMHELIPGTRQTKGRPMKMGSHSAHGRQAANSISLNNQIDGKGSSVRLLGSR
jgi:uncharacterized protein DUF2786